jgi:hypothetical protein
MSDYAPGTVAIATVNGTKGVKVFRYRDVYGHNRWDSQEPIMGSGSFSVVVHDDKDVTDIKPLVVLDLGHHPAMYVHALRWVEHQSGQGEPFVPSPANERNDACWMADQIEAQTKPPRIPEPGLWGVVSARLTEECQAENCKGPLAGDFIHSTDGSWRNADTGFGVVWLELDSPTLVREGVQS